MRYDFIQRHKRELGLLASYVQHKRHRLRYELRCLLLDEARLRYDFIQRHKRRLGLLASYLQHQRHRLRYGHATCYLMRHGCAMTTYCAISAG